MDTHQSDSTYRRIGAGNGLNWTVQEWPENCSVSVTGEEAHPIPHCYWEERSMKLSMKNRSLSASTIAVIVLGLYACGVAATDAKVELEGSQEVPAVKTDATGTGEFKVSGDGMVSGSVTTNGIEGTAAHIHGGAKGVNGPPIITLTKKGDTYSVPANTKLTEAQMESFENGELYVNVHSAAHPEGEVRDQLDP
jgi:hypothetical protein